MRWPATGPVPKPCHVEAGEVGNGGDDVTAVGRAANPATPALCALNPAERREPPQEFPSPFFEKGERWRGIERAHRLNRRPRAERPAPRDPPLLEKAPAD